MPKEIAPLGRREEVCSDTIQNKGLFRESCDMAWGSIDGAEQICRLGKFIWNGHVRGRRELSSLVAHKSPRFIVSFRKGG